MRQTLGPPPDGQQCWGVHPRDCPIASNVDLHASQAAANSVLPKDIEHETLQQHLTTFAKPGQAKGRPGAMLTSPACPSAGGALLLPLDTSAGEALLPRAASWAPFASGLLANIWCRSSSSEKAASTFWVLLAAACVPQPVDARVCQNLAYAPHQCKIIANRDA